MSSSVLHFCLIESEKRLSLLLDLRRMLLSSAKRVVVQFLRTARRVVNRLPTVRELFVLLRMDEQLCPGRSVDAGR